MLINTLTLSLSQKCRQDGNGKSPIKAFDPAEVKEHMGIANEKMQEYKLVDGKTFLGSKKATGDNVIQYFNEVFGAPAKEKRQTVFFLLRIS